MEPEEWERQADEAARGLGEELDRLEGDFWPLTPSTSFSRFWPRVKDLGERIRTAPAIRLEDKLSLQSRLSALVRQARTDQTNLREERARRERALVESLDHLEEVLGESGGVEDIQEVRADLALLRERITSRDEPLDRATHTRLWERWQSLNTAAWDALNRAWSENEQQLEALLDGAQERLKAADQRGARETIQRFHSAVSHHPCSHAALKRLRDRARSLWNEADALAQQKHAAYLTNASRRLGQWKAQRDRLERQATALQQEIDDLDARARTAPTPVAAALARAQAEERRRALTRLQSENRELGARIASAEAALAGS